MELADLFQLQAQPMTKRTFRTQLIEQRFGLIECVWRNVLALEEVSKATLHFGF
jgi:hypothetical protein